ncbi:MAG TPA: hypothetical protein VGH76_16610 [Actinomycetospora sp.]
MHINDGHVVICEPLGDPVDHHLASNIAMAVAGVKTVDALLRATCPHH